MRATFELRIDNQNQCRTFVNSPIPARVRCGGACCKDTPFCRSPQRQVWLKVGMLLSITRLGCAGTLGWA